MTQTDDINRLNALVKGEIPECNMKVNLETTLKNCRRDDYHEEYCFDGFYLMLMIDEDPGEVRKNFWQIIGPDGSTHDTPEHLFTKSFTYRKITYEHFLFMVHRIKGDQS